MGDLAHYLSKEIFPAPALGKAVEKNAPVFHGDV
jgi:hypothetical protein